MGTHYYRNFMKWTFSHKLGWPIIKNLSPYAGLEPAIGGEKNTKISFLLNGTQSVASQKRKMKSSVAKLKSPPPGDARLKSPPPGAAGGMLGAEVKEEDDDSKGPQPGIAAGNRQPARIGNQAQEQEQEQDEDLATMMARTGAVAKNGESANV